MAAHHCTRRQETPRDPRSKESAMRVVTCIMVACLVLTAGSVSAEWFADVYIGQSFTEKNDVTVHSSAGLGIFQDVEFDRSLAYGGRFGRYFDGLPFLGLGMDVFNFSPRIGPQRVRVDGKKLKTSIPRPRNGKPSK